MTKQSHKNSSMYGFVSYIGYQTREIGWL